MKGAGRIFVFMLCAGLAGWGTGEFLCRATWTRQVAGRILGRGELLAVVRGRAIYGRDLAQGDDARAVTLVAAEALRRAGRGTQITDANLERELQLLRDQFGDPEKFAQALESSHLTNESLRALLADHLARAILFRRSSRGAEERDGGKSSGNFMRKNGRAFSCRRVFARVIFSWPRPWELRRM